MNYAATYSNPSTHAYFSVSGTTMSVDARHVNTSSVNNSYWTVTKQIRVRMTSSSTAVPTYHYVGITVRPCKVNATGISTMYTRIGNKLERTFSAHPFTYGENTTGICGNTVYELVGGNTPYLTFNAGARKLTHWPKSTAYQNTRTHTIKSYCANFPLNYTNYNFNVVGQAPCSGTYNANRLSIAAYPSS
jgi:hypothetical protein